MSLKSALIVQSDAYKVFNADDYLRIYLICVHPSYEKKNLSKDLLYAVYEEAAALNIKAVAGMFTSAKDQKTASEVGFKFMSEIHYNNWKVKDENFSGNPGTDNYSVSFMGRLTPNRMEQKKFLENRKRIWKMENEAKSLEI